MKLEQVLPQLRDGQTITRNKAYNQSATVEVQNYLDKW